MLSTSSYIVMSRVLCAELMALYTDCQLSSGSAKTVYGDEAAASAVDEDPTTATTTASMLINLT
ncbi:hypothetical protein [Amycolatopsis sp. NBC_01480]|uniref:hypothetical protein n=1 Tax=Amycolatopsis sp. NBC_01480 TaxID=2903562 RepID=UPI002E2D58A6|nr:hypothetical protein [Amycolatopsis sp. NBC_01480]